MPRVIYCIHALRSVVVLRTAHMFSEPAARCWAAITSRALYIAPTRRQACRCCIYVLHLRAVATLSFDYNLLSGRVSCPRPACTVGKAKSALCLRSLCLDNNYIMLLQSVFSRSSSLQVKCPKTSTPSAASHHQHVESYSSLSYVVDSVICWSFACVIYPCLK